MLTRLALKSSLYASLKEVNKQTLCKFNTSSCLHATKSSDAPCEEVRIPVPWGHIAGKWWGPRDKQPIFAFHGWQDSCGSFDRIIPLLPKHQSFLALDLPGHGYSSHLPLGIYYYQMNGIILVQRLQKYFNFEKIALMGHSLGAILSYIYAGLYPQQMDKLICIDGLNPLLNPKRLERVRQGIELFFKYDAHAKSMSEGVSEPPCYTMDAITEMVFKASRSSIDKDKCSYIVERNVRESVQQPGLFYFTRDPRLKTGPLLNWPLEDVLEHARHITMPLLGTKTDRAPPLNLELAEKVKKIILEVNPRAEFHPIIGRHHEHLNKPELFTEIVSNFINKYADSNRDIDPKLFEQIRHV